MQKTAQHLLDTLEKARPFLMAISDMDAAQKPNPSKWSKKEILGHLIDSACNNQQKFVRTMAQTHTDFVGYQQDDWVSLQHYQKSDWQDLITFWLAYNRHIAHIIGTVSEDFLANTISIQGSKPFALSFIMEDYVEHLKHHLGVIIPEAKFESKFSNVYNA